MAFPISLRVPWFRQPAPEPPPEPPDTLVSIQRQIGELRAEQQYDRRLLEDANRERQQLTDSVLEQSKQLLAQDRLIAQLQQQHTDQDKHIERMVRELSDSTKEISRLHTLLEQSEASRTRMGERIGELEKQAGEYRALQEKYAALEKQLVRARMIDLVRQADNNELRRLLRETGQTPPEPTPLPAMTEFLSEPAPRSSS